MFGGFGAGELLIILVFALIFIGPKKLPELAKGLGKGLREFQKAKDDLMDHVNDVAQTNDASSQKVESETAVKAEVKLDEENQNQVKESDKEVQS